MHVRFATLTTSYTTTDNYKVVIIVTTNFSWYDTANSPGASATVSTGTLIDDVNLIGPGYARAYAEVRYYQDVKKGSIITTNFGSTSGQYSINTELYLI